MKKEGSGRSDDFFVDVEEDLGNLEQTGSAKKALSLEKELKKAMHRLGKFEMLSDITKSLNSTLNLNALLSDIVDSVIKLADADRGFLMLADKENELQFRIARDMKEQSLNQKDFEVSHSIISDVFRKGDPLFISNVSENEQFKNQKSVIDLRLLTAVCVPLKLEERIIGVIYTDSIRLTNELSEKDVPIITAFASQAAIAIENARLHGELILSRENLANENRILRHELSEKYEFSGIIGKSKPMQDIFSMISKIAPLETTVLIRGETGTGKELIAKAIHFNGPRKEKQMVTINCGAMPAELLESELFGHKKGSFTGATSDKPGLFETAHGGSIFLDEIGDMPIQLQVKLLRTLQEGEIRRIGENVTRKVDVRIIAATNRDLTDDINKGLFRQDLFYRLNVVPVNIPPLRDRKDDILPLTEYFLKKYSAVMGKEEVRIVPETMKLLITNKWPGNIRELENTIERALALCGDSKLLSKDFFPQFSDDPGFSGEISKHGSLKQKLSAVEKQIITDILEETDGKVTHAAKILDVTRQHLHNRIKFHGIKRR
ncbi:MAG: sigma 54-interacting transcriptional regulator [Candidatus Krumholzibacteriota bacterium]|nr:sigma 54-interacting transcriptional regulator [Candidatus Krumholzibacteriota bacterium]